jgi:peptide/nickel transport system permease protein
MLLFGLRRLLQSLPTVLAAALTVFVLFSVIPGSIATSMFEDGRGMDAAVMERIRKELGLDDPVHVRFANYVSKLAVLDPGLVQDTRAEGAAARQAVRPTFQLVVAAMAFAILIGVPLGFVAAMRPGGVIERSDVRRVPGLRSRHSVRPADDVPVRIEARLVSDLRLRGEQSCRQSRTDVAPLALLARTNRAAVLDVVNADFVRTARSKGMSETRVVRWHVLRNVAVIVLTTLGLQFGALMGQAVVVEKLFSWPGVGSLLVDSVFQRDIPAVQGCILLIVLFFLINR